MNKKVIIITGFLGNFLKISDEIIKLLNYGTSSEVDEKLLEQELIIKKEFLLNLETPKLYQKIINLKNKFKASVFTHSFDGLLGDNAKYLVGNLLDDTLKIPLNKNIDLTLLEEELRELKEDDIFIAIDIDNYFINEIAKMLRKSKIERIYLQSKSIKNIDLKNFSKVLHGDLLKTLKALEKYLSKSDVILNLTKEEIEIQNIFKKYGIYLRDRELKSLIEILSLEVILSEKEIIDRFSKEMINKNWINKNSTIEEKNSFFIELRGELLKRAINHKDFKVEREIYILASKKIDNYLNLPNTDENELKKHYLIDKELIEKIYKEQLQYGKNRVIVFSESILSEDEKLEPIALYGKINRVRCQECDSIYSKPKSNSKQNKFQNFLSFFKQEKKFICKNCLNINYREDVFYTKDRETFKILMSLIDDLFVNEKIYIDKRVFSFEESFLKVMKNGLIKKGVLVEYI